ncbi:radical SAM protein [Phocaeicola sp.]
MKTPQMNKVYVLNPHYHLRHDIHRVALFSSTGAADTDCSRNWHTFIHPLQAVMLSFFTYDRPLQETLPLLCNFFCRSTEEMLESVSEFINNPTPVYTSSQQGKVYFPKRILIEAEEAGSALRFDQLEPNSFIWKKLDLTTRRLYSGPLLLTFMLTNRCVTRCKYCYADTSTPVRSPLPTARIMELIEEASRLQVQQINLIGGEIFLHKDWKMILAELVKRNIGPEFISTKMPVTHSLLKDLLETGYQGIIQVSLDAYNPRILADSLGVKERYNREVLKGLHLLEGSGLNYQVSSVLTRYNCDVVTLAELYHQLSALRHIRDWRIIPASNSGSKDYKEFSQLKPSKAQITETFNELYPLIANAPFPVILGDAAIRKQYRDTWGGSRNFKGSECSALTTHMFILPDGKVTACEQLYWHPRFIIGDVTMQGLKEVWDSPRAMELCALPRCEISEQSACKECSLFKDCYSYQNRCWSDIIKAYGAEHWDFPDPRCAYAPPMKNKLDYD